MFRVVSILITLASGFVSWLVYHAFAVHMGSNDPVFLATFVLLAVAFHEAGHMILMELAGAKCVMFFAVIVGGVTPWSGINVEKIPWSKRADISLAGCYGNLACIAFSLLLLLFGVINPEQMSRITNLNGSLILFNLLPFGMLDGGQFARIFFDSSPEHKDDIYYRAMAGATMLAVLAMWIVTNQAYFITVGLLTWGLKRRAECDDPQGCYHPLAIPQNELRLWAIIYTLLICIGIGLLCTTHPWVWN
jgi:Zn-dependent protease